MLDIRANDIVEIKTKDNRNHAGRVLSTNGGIVLDVSEMYHMSTRFIPYRDVLQVVDVIRRSKR